MSFGYSVGDAVALVQLAWNTYQGAKKACGEYDELTSAVGSVHRVLQRLQRELANPDSLLNRADDDRRQELTELGSGCEQILKIMNTIVSKYNTLAEQKRSPKKIWKRIQFGNGETHDLADLRSKLSIHTSAITLSINLCSLGSQGRMEKQLNSVGGELEGINGKVDFLVASMAARSGEGTVWTSYEDDDKAFWRELRRGLVKEGYRSSVLHKHKHLIKKYVEELGSRGAFDQDEDTLIVDDKEEDLGGPIAAVEEDPEKLRPDSHKHATVEDVLENSEAEGEEDSSSERLALEATLGSSQMSGDEPHSNSGSSSTGNVHVLENSRYKSTKESERPRPSHLEGATNDESSIGDNDDSSTDGEIEHSSLSTGDFKNTTNDEGEQQSQVTSESSPPIFESIDSESSRSIEEIRDGKSSLSSSGSGKENEPSSTDDNLTNEEPEYRIPYFLFKPPFDLSTLDDPRGYIKLKDCLGRKLSFPFFLVDTWMGLESLIKQAFEQNDHFGHIKEGHYNLVCPHGDIILPLAWKDTIQPNWLVAMDLWPGFSLSTDVPQEAPPVESVVFEMDPNTSHLPLQVPSLHVKFVDAVGRRYSFPFNLVMTWAGIEMLINQAFKHIEIPGLALGPFVEEGRYDLILFADDLLDKDYDGQILLPQVWEHAIQPHSTVKMFLHPLPDPAIGARNSAKAKQSLSTPGVPVAKSAPGDLPSGVTPLSQKGSSTSDVSGIKSSALASPQPERKDLSAVPASPSVPRAGPAPIVKLTDCVGRKFPFPWDMVRTREGMHDLIRQAFLHVEILGPYIVARQYSLFRTHDNANLGMNWDKIVVPGLEITMKMWRNSYSQTFWQNLPFDTIREIPDGVLTCIGPSWPNSAYSARGFPVRQPSPGRPPSQNAPKRAKNSKALPEGVLGGMPGTPKKETKESKQHSKGVLGWMAGASKK